jgi:hypothetical protein
MKMIRPSLERGFLVVAVASAALAWCVLTPQIVSGAGKPAAAAAAQKDLGTGELVIVRSANLGQIVVGISIDGVQKAKINFNGRYQTSLSVGPHTITAIPIPNREHAQPTQTRVNVEKGKTYTLTALRSDVAIALK